MNLTWHIAKKDCRRFWLGALLVAGLVGAKLALVEGVFYNEISRDWSKLMMIYQALIWIAGLFFTFFLAVAVVQEDPVSDPGAFWQTLPISRRQLLAAKLLSVILLCVLPAMMALGLGWVAYALPSGRIGFPMEMVCAVQLGLGLLAFAFGSLARNTAHVLFWLVGVVLSFILLLLIIEPLIIHHQEVFVAPGVSYTHLTLMLVVWVIAAAAITMNQFLGRSRKRAIIFLTVSVVLSLFLVETCKAPFALDLTSVLLPAQHALDRKVSQWKAGIVEAELSQPRLGAGATVLLRISIDQSDPQWTASPITYVGQWMVPGLDQPPALARIYHAEYNPVRAFVVRALGFQEKTSADQVVFGAETKIPVTDAERLVGRSASHQGKISLVVWPNTVEGKLTLREGSTLHSDCGAAKIVRVDSDGSIVEVELEERMAPLDPGPGWMIGLTSLVVPRTAFHYFLVNQGAREVLTPADSSTGAATYAYGVLFAHAKYQFVLPAHKSGDVNLDDWKLIEIRSGYSQNEIKTFLQDVHLNVVPAVKRDPDWLD